MTLSFATLIDVEDPSDRRWSPRDSALWASWSLVMLLLVRSHEMWRDELQSLAIARASTWPWDLIANTDYEGHPPGWHLLLWFPAQLTRSPGAAHLIGFACVSAAGWLVIRYLPFTLPVRGLLLFGYFPLFEMGVITRSYSLLFLLVVAALVLADRRPLPVIPLTIVLVAMSWTLVTAIPLAAAIAISTVMRHTQTPRQRFIEAGAVLGALTLLSLKIAQPPWSGPGKFAGGLQGINTSSSVFTSPLRVVAPWFERNVAFWGDFSSSRLDSREALLGVLVLLLITIVLLRCPPAVLVWLVGTVGLLWGLNSSSLRIEPRHLTVLWLTLVAAIWIAASESVSKRATVKPTTADPTFCSIVWRALDPWISPGLLRALGVVALFIAVAGVWWPATTELREPFSGAEEAADWVRANSDSDLAVFCASEAPACSSVAIRLDVPAYTTSSGNPFTFVVWNGRWRQRVAPEVVESSARKLQARLGQRVVVVAHAYDYPPGCDRGWASPPTIVTTERVVVCFVDQLLPSSTPGT